MGRFHAIQSLYYWATIILKGMLARNLLMSGLDSQITKKTQVCLKYVQDRS